MPAYADFFTGFTRPVHVNGLEKGGKVNQAPAWGTGDSDLDDTEEGTGETGDADSDGDGGEAAGTGASAGGSAGDDLKMAWVCQAGVKPTNLTPHEHQNKIQSYRHL